MSKPHGKPVLATEVLIEPKYDLEKGEEMPLPKPKEPSYPKFTPARRKQILLLRQASFFPDKIAAKVRITPTTLRRWLYIGEMTSDDATGIYKEFRDFYLDYMEAEVDGLINTRALIEDRMKKDNKVLMWAAERLHPREFGRGGRGGSDVTLIQDGSGGRTIEVRTKLEQLSDEDIDHLIRLHDKAAGDVVEAEVVDDEKGNGSTED